MSKGRTTFVIKDFTQAKHDEVTVKRGDVVKVTIKYQGRHKITNSVGKIGFIPSEILSDVDILETSLKNIATPFEKLIELRLMKKRRKCFAKIFFKFSSSSKEGNKPTKYCQ
jgi:hypothetical protein